MENRTDNNPSESTVSEYFGTALFFISFLPLIYAIYKSFTGYFFFAWFFGFSAMLFVLVDKFMVFIPVICLIYQFFFFKNHIVKNKDLLKATLIFFGTIILTMLCSSILAETNLDRMQRSVQAKIKPHLTALYGEEAAANMTYDVVSKNSMSFEGHSPVLPSDISFELWYNTSYDISDNLTIKFKETNEGFFNEFVQYVVEKNGLPSDMNYRISIVSVDFQDYKNGDDYKNLFERTKYVITGLDVSYKSITEDEAMNVINRVWKEILPKVPADEPSFTIRIRTNDSFDTDIEITRHLQNNSATAVIHVWSNSSSLYGLNKKAIELAR